jgi:hypothetical protein
MSNGLPGPRRQCLRSAPSRARDRAAAGQLDWNVASRTRRPRQGWAMNRGSSAMKWSDGSTAIVASWARRWTPQAGNRMPAAVLRSTGWSSTQGVGPAAKCFSRPGRSPASPPPGSAIQNESTRKRPPYSTGRPRPQASREDPSRFGSWGWERRGGASSSGRRARTSWRAEPGAIFAGRAPIPGPCRGRASGEDRHTELDPGSARLRRTP